MMGKYSWESGSVSMVFVGVFGFGLVIQGVNYYI